ncbi:MAG: O-antigen ligase family protein, partial [Beijerinckiaceae bacterium]
MIPATEQSGAAAGQDTFEIFGQPPLNAVFGVLVIATVVAAVIAPHGLSWLPVVALAIAFTIDGQHLLIQADRQDVMPLFFGAALLAWAGVTTTWSPDPVQGAINVARAAGSLIIGYGCILLGRRIAPVRVSQCWGLIVTHSGLLIVLAVIFAGWVTLVPVRGERSDIGYTSWAFNRAAVLAVLLAPCVLAAFLVVARTARQTLLTLIWGLLFVGIIVWSASETAKLALLVLTPMLLAAIWSRRMAVYAMLAGLAFALLVLPHLVALYGEQWMQMPFARLNPSTIKARLELWIFVSKLISNAPAAGLGVEAVRTTLYYSSVSGGVIEAVHPHSILFQLWVDLGLIGCLLFL